MKSCLFIMLYFTSICNAQTYKTYAGTIKNVIIDSQEWSFNFTFYLKLNDTSNKAQAVIDFTVAKYPRNFNKEQKKQFDADNTFGFENFWEGTWDKNTINLSYLSLLKGHEYLGDFELNISDKTIRALGTNKKNSYFPKDYLFIDLIKGKLSESGADIAKFSELDNKISIYNIKNEKYTMLVDVLKYASTSSIGKYADIEDVLENYPEKPLSKSEYAIFSSKTVGLKIEHYFSRAIWKMGWQ